MVAETIQIGNGWTTRPDLVRTSRNVQGSPPVASESSPVRVGAQTTEEWIDIDRLVIDDAYQRTVKPNWVRYISRNFDPSLFGKPLVAVRSDGTYAVIDGQHRIEAVRMRFEGRSIKVLCDVSPSGTVADEAKQFRGRNIETRHPSAGERFKARLAEREPGALEIDSIVRRNGFELQLYSGVQVEGRFQCVAAIEKLAAPGRVGLKQGTFASSGPALLEKVLGVVRDAWGGSTDGVGSVTLLGIGTFINRYNAHEVFDRRRLIHVLRQVSARKIERDTKDAATFFGGSNQIATARLILGEYNKRLDPKNRLPEWTDARA